MGTKIKKCPQHMFCIFVASSGGLPGSSGPIFIFVATLLMKKNPIANSIQSWRSNPPRTVENGPDKVFSF